MAHEVSEVKVKIPTQAELAKVKVDEQGLTTSQIADLMVLLAKDLKKEVKEGAKKVKKAAAPEGEEKPKKEKNTWFKFLDHVRAKVKELKAEVKLVATEPTQFASYLKEASLYPQENVSDEVLSAKFDEWYAIPKDERPKKAKAEPKPKAVKADKRSAPMAREASEVKVAAPVALANPTPTPASTPTPKPKAKKPTAEEVVVKPAEGVFLPQKVKGTKYLTSAYDGDDLIYLYNEAQEYVGAYDPKGKEIDQTVVDPCA
jgi:hypothetical protein